MSAALDAYLATPETVYHQPPHHLAPAPEAADPHPLSGVPLVLAALRELGGAGHIDTVARHTRLPRRDTRGLLLTARDRGLVDRQRDGGTYLYTLAS